MDTPDSLGEKYHLLQARADVNYWIGRSLRALGRGPDAVAAFESSATESGDFTEMAVTEHSPLSWYRGLSLRELGRDDDARALFEDLMRFGEAGLQQTASIDYFATSLPNLLVFEEDLQARRDAGHPSGAKKELLMPPAYTEDHLVEQPSIQILQLKLSRDFMLSNLAQVLTTPFVTGKYVHPRMGIYVHSPTGQNCPEPGGHQCPPKKRAQGLDA